MKLQEKLLSVLDFAYNGKTFQMNSRTVKEKIK